MRVPLSWLRDFAPFDGEPADLAATLDDLGLVVEEIVRVGEGLGDLVVARVLSIDAIEGADKIRRVMVDTGGVEVEGLGADGVQVVCGAWNFEVGDLVPLAPVGAVLPGAFAIGRRKMKGVVSNGMLCSGRELELSDDHAGILVLNDVVGARPGQPFTQALGIAPDVVFDVAVEANRPDAWCIAGVARDLAARLGLPFAIPSRGHLGAGRRHLRGRLRRSGLGPGRGHRTVPALHRPGRDRRAGGPLPGLGGSAADPGRDASHQQRGRRLQLRDARARPAHPPLRPRPAARARPSGSPGRTRRAGHHPRRRGAGARPSRPRARATPGRTA